MDRKSSTGSPVYGLKFLFSNYEHIDVKEICPVHEKGQDSLRRFKKVNDSRINSISAVWYTDISLDLALAFFLLTGGGKYESVARYGGAIWVFILP